MKNGRTPYQGVCQILQYNRGLYAKAAAGVAAAILFAPYLSPLWYAAVLMSAGVSVLWICSSLAVSHYIYDRSQLYDLRWLVRRLTHIPKQWVNVHAGLDETSRLFESLFPSASGTVLDIYDPLEMTEPSIAVARRISPSQVTTTCASWRALPLASGTFDAAFVMFAAHELRRSDARVQLFRELARALRPGGELAVVEHLRDWANFVAFGPGFLHFLSRRAWKNAAAAAGLRVRAEMSMTPFVRAFIMEKTV